MGELQVNLLNVQIEMTKYILNVNTLDRYLYNVFFSLSAPAAGDTTSGGGAPWPALYLARAPESDPDLLERGIMPEARNQGAKNQ